MRSICVFGASSAAIEEKYIRHAYETGALIAKRGYSLVFGAGDTGLMGACARGVTDQNGTLTGVIPEKLNQPGIAYQHCTTLTVTPDMHARKAEMERLSDAYIALAGGFGTLEELMEVLTLNQLGYISAPVVILNSYGFYTPLLEQLELFSERGFTDKRCLGLYHAVETPEEAISALESFVLPALPDKLAKALGHKG